MLLNKESAVMKCLQDSLGDPEYCDVKIVAFDGELSVSKFLLCIRSHYFRAMFSEDNNFSENQTGRVKMPYSKAVLEKLIIYLYSGKMNCEEMTLASLLDLLDLLNLTSYPEEFVAVESYTIKKIRNLSFSLSDCLMSLEHCYRLKLETVESTLLTRLGGAIPSIIPSESEAWGALSGDMLGRLLQERREDQSMTIYRFRTLVIWLSVNSETNKKDELLKMIDFDHFNIQDLATDVRKSGLYETDRIIERMAELHQTEISEFETDIQIIKNSTNGPYDPVYDDYLPWNQYVPRSIQQKYDYL